MVYLSGHVSNKYSIRRYKTYRRYDINSFQSMCAMLSIHIPNLASNCMEQDTKCNAYLDIVIC